MAVRVVTPPTGGIITLDELKAQCRVDFADDDALLTRLCLTATASVQKEVQRLYLAQTVEWVLECWPNRSLPFAGYGRAAEGMAIESVIYADWDGNMQTLDPALYWARCAGQTLKVVPRRFVLWPILGDAADIVVIRVTVSGSADTAPPDAKHAALLLASHWYAHPDAVVGVDNRDSSTELPRGVTDLLLGEQWVA